MKAKDLKDLNKPIKVLLHGGCGNGKTALISQLSNGYLMDLDAGMLTALKLKDKFTKYRHEIEFDTFQDESFRNPQGWNKFYAKLLKIAELTNKGKWEYDALGIDSMTGITQLIRHHVMFSKVGDALAEPLREHWGMMVNCMEAVCSIIQTLKVPVFITAHDCTVYTEDSVEYKVLSMTKNHGEKIPWMFDEVWLSQIKKIGVKRCFTVSGIGTASREAKSKMNLGKDVDHTEIGLPGIFKIIDYKYDFDKPWREPAQTKEVESVVVEPKVEVKKEVIKSSSADNLLGKS